MISDISDHLLIYHIQHAKPPPEPINNYFSRIINNKTTSELKTALTSIQWNLITDNDNPQTAYSMFHDTLIKQINTHMPIKEFKHRTKMYKPWLTKELKDKIKMKNKLYKKSIKQKTLKSISEYKTYKNRLNHLLRTAEKHYYHNELENAKQDIKLGKSSIRS